MKKSAVLGVGGRGLAWAATASAGAGQFFFAGKARAGMNERNGVYGME